jgi:hypothetical protein
MKIHRYKVQSLKKPQQPRQPRQPQVSPQQNDKN